MDLDSQGNFPRPLRATLRPWLWAALAVVVSMGATTLLQPMIGSRPFAFALPAVVILALFVGVTPALFAAIGCALWPLASSIALHASPPADFLPMGIFLALSFVLSILIGKARSKAYFAGVRRGSQRETIDPASLPRTALVRWLTASMYASILLPATFFVAAAWYGYQQTIDKAGQELARANRISDQLLQNSINTNVATLQRLKVLAGTATDEALRLREKELHEHLVELAAGRIDTQAIWIWGANGRAVATNRFYPVPQDTVITDREYFRVHQKGDVGLYISDVLFGRISAEHFFNISARRNLADGSFGGIVSVSMYPSFFAGAYASMAHDMQDLTITLAREDGRILARWPVQPGDVINASMGQDALNAIASKQATGRFTHASTADGKARMISYRRIGQWPLYVFAGLSHRAILTDWYRYVLILAAFTLSVAIGMAYVSWVALRLTRREQLAQAELQTENLRRLQAEEALLQAQKLEALGQLTGGVAHDVNNLLMVIGTNTHVHRKLSPQLAADNAQLAAIDRSVAAGAKLTRQLLSFSRKQAVAPQTLRLQDQLAGMLDLVRSSLGANTDLQLQVAPETRLVCLDPVEFELALINLSLNAKDAMTQGKVTITACNGVRGDIPTAPDADVVIVRFSDNGCGVEPQNLERLFEPFFTTKPPGRGTGLGLSQVYGFCAQAGGTARIESTLGVGTTVSMYFPALDTEHVQRDPIKQPASAQTLKGHILLVEDNDDVGKSTIELLTSLGLTAHRENSGDEALSFIRNNASKRFDAVLSDIYMPGELSGIDLANILRRDFPELPVVLMTGYAAEEHKAVEAGFKVLSKPFSPDTLVEALGEAMQGTATASR